MLACVSNEFSVGGSSEGRSRRKASLVHPVMAYVGEKN